MGIEEAVRNLCNRKPKLRSVVIGTRFSEEERDQIRANGIIKGDQACAETTK